MPLRGTRSFRPLAGLDEAAQTWQLIPDRGCIGVPLRCELLSSVGDLVAYGVDRSGIGVVGAVDGEEDGEALVDRGLRLERLRIDQADAVGELEDWNEVIA
jgi:hypothetical protein